MRTDRRQTDPPRSGVRGHLGAAADQAVSSVTNVVAVIAVARLLPAEQFGVFAVVYAGLTLYLGFSRAFFGLPIALGASRSVAEQRRSFSHSISATVILSFPVVALLFALGLEVAPEPSVIVSVALPTAAAAVCIGTQDVCRYFAIATDRSRVALASDLVWLVGALAVFAFGSVLPPGALLWVWAAIVGVSLVICLAALRPSFELREGFRALRPRRGLRESAAAVVLLSAATSLVVAFLTASALGLSASGALRGAGTLLGPVNTLVAFLDFSVLSHLARRSRSGDGAALAVIATVATVTAAAWSAVLLLMPGAVGQQVLGATWTGTRSILPITVVEYLMLAATAAASTVLKVRNASTPLLRNKVISSAAIVCLCVLAVSLSQDLRWVAAALAAGALLGLVLALSSAVRSVRREEVADGGR